MIQHVNRIMLKKSMFSATLQFSRCANERDVNLTGVSRDITPLSAKQNGT